MRALLLLPLLVLAGCKAKPKPVTLAGYTFTSAWDASLDKKEHLEIVKFTGSGGKAVCLFQKIDLKGASGEGLEDKLVKKFKGENLAPATLDTSLGTFTGHTFDGKVPSEGAMGLVAQLAGAAHGEQLALQTETGLLAFTIVRFGDGPDGKKGFDQCLETLATVTAAN